MKEHFWESSAHQRRFILFLLTVLPSFYGAAVMKHLMPQDGLIPLEWVITVLFFLLFCWISIGFWTACFGFIVLMKGSTRFFPTTDATTDPIDPQARTAILIPVFGENMKRVMAGLAAVYDSLKATGELKHFDFFILSDTTDPDGWIVEETAWHDFCTTHQAFSNVFYRRRRSNVKRKSGNVADFCRRWGRLYRYLIVFDADSIMKGQTLVRMVRTMERRPDIGILQSLPSNVNRTSLIGRAQQFAGHLYGPAFAAGLHYWQLGDAQYWGHNVIIRTEPFMKHCQLPRLPGHGPLSGDILSHDFVEAALMRRAGYGVWLACDLDGSYEESPPTLIDELKRDRRWCQGNLQHSRLIFAGGLFPTHRFLFVNGIMSYGSALLWLAFLLCCSLQAIWVVVVPPSYFSGAPSLFPQWPTWSPLLAVRLLSVTAIMLFTPKILSLIVTIRKGQTASFGGGLSLALSMAGEVIFSALLAPLRMIYHSLFVVATLLGRRVSWNTQSRDDDGTSWADAFLIHWWCSLFGLLWGGLMWLINPGFFWWLSPVIAPLVLSIPLSVFSSRVSLGNAAKRAGIFTTPQERQPDEVLQQLAKELQHPENYSTLSFSSCQGFLRAVVDPLVFGLHCSLLLRHRMPSQAQKQRRHEIVCKAINYGPESLTKAEKLEILRDTDQLKVLHEAVWNLEDDTKASQWGLAHPGQTFCSI